MSTPRTDEVRLRHMREAAVKALGFVRGCTRADLDRDEKLALAIVRLIEILGKAAKNVSDTNSRGLCTRF